MKLALGRALYDPGDPTGKLFFNTLATFAEFEADLIRMRTREGMASPAPRGNCAASSPNCPTDSSGSSAACLPRASIPSATSPNSIPSQDQPAIVRSTGAIPLSVRSCPLPESTRECSMRHSSPRSLQNGEDVYSGSCSKRYNLGTFTRACESSR